MRVLGLSLLASAALFVTGADAKLSLAKSLAAVEASKERPIAKIVKMLEDMKSQLESEAADDAEVYEKLTCWCKKNREEKEAAITLAEKTIANLEAEMGEDAAKIAELKETISAQRKENRKNQKALDDATELRFKERKAFHEEEKDMLATIDACKQAIVVLSQHHPELAQLKAVAKNLLSTKVIAESAHSMNAEGKSTIEGIVALKGFLTNVQHAGSFLQIPGFQSYAPQSGEVFGMLKQMKETFEGNLSEAQKEEMDKRAAYAELKAAKEEELKAGRTQLANAKESLANFKQKYAEAEEALANTNAQLKIDQEFLANLNEKCSQTDADYAMRTKARNEEISAVADTIAILNSDDAFDQFDKTVNSETTGTNFDGVTDVSSFLQVNAKTASKEKLLALLERAAAKDPKVALIATYAKLDAFTKVKKAIADMIDELKVQQKDEVDHRDFCLTEFQKNKMETEATTDEHDNLVAKIGDLTATIDTLASEIKTLNDEIAEMTEQAKRATDDRGKENADFQVELKDQRLTQAILQKALERMAGQYYTKYQLLQAQQPGAAHMELSGTKTAPGSGPAKFKEMSDNAGGMKVVNLLESVIADSKATEKDLLVSETDAQVAYEGFMKDTSKSIDIKQQAVVAKTSEKATAEGDKTAAMTAKAAAIKMLEEQADYKSQLHGSCDFLISNFDMRQEARAQEMEALRQADGILSGMK